MADFIDRASIQAEAAAYGELMHDRAERPAYHAFMAGAAEYAELIDAEVTESEVEAAARKIFEYDAPSHEPDEWSGLSEPLKSDYRGTARAALEAARKVK